MSADSIRRYKLFHLVDRTVKLQKIRKNFPDSKSLALLEGNEKKILESDFKKLSPQQLDNALREITDQLNFETLLLLIKKFFLIVIVILAGIGLCSLLGYNFKF